MPAEKCIHLLKHKLEAFGLNLDTDTVGICTHGASVMCKVGKLIGVQHQPCLAHGIHLAVHDVLYIALTVVVVISILSSRNREKQKLQMCQVTRVAVITL